VREPAPGVNRAASELRRRQYGAASGYPVRPFVERAHDRQRLIGDRFSHCRIGIAVRLE
jgi:hypothetical protein